MVILCTGLKLYQKVSGLHLNFVVSLYQNNASMDACLILHLIYVDNCWVGVNYKGQIYAKVVVLSMPFVLSCYNYYRLQAFSQLSIILLCEELSMEVS